MVGTWQPDKVNPQHLARDQEQSSAFCVHERERNDQFYGILVNDNNALLFQKISATLSSPVFASFEIRSTAQSKMAYRKKNIGTINVC